MSQFSSTIIIFVLLIVISYGLITVVVHNGLKSVVKNFKFREAIVQMLSVVVFAVIASSMFRD